MFGFIVLGLEFVKQKLCSLAWGGGKQAFVTEFGTWPFGLII